MAKKRGENSKNENQEKRKTQPKSQNSTFMKKVATGLLPFSRCWVETPIRWILGIS
jgi:hypothetical protein